MIFRFSAMKGFNLLSPFNPARRAAIYVYTHPYPLSRVICVNATPTLAVSASPGLQEQSDSGSDGSSVMGQMGQQIWTGHVRQGSAPMIR